MQILVWTTRPAGRQKQLAGTFTGATSLPYAGRERAQAACIRELDWRLEFGRYRKLSETSGTATSSGEPTPPQALVLHLKRRGHTSNISGRETAVEL